MQLLKSREPTQQHREHREDFVFYVTEGPVNAHLRLVDLAELEVDSFTLR